ncbi:ABC transporter ATP-binding protein [Mesorhizobium microcysteis]|uniref:ABC transporter ATP-binding protein n=2 Tax=Neoaquamicrobium microcysteis TaxID=2682781 RepID=A0A5D4H425_9HYPH|nr:ABC transporter ATP-binding protein [Mesorhizobium microcysteis]TYR33560.1 ABC transporter ATP-binding protein [Mesorhizobium microcysteis]
MLLEARELSVSFGGIKAVDSISFAVEPGEIFTIIGPNGAGKTTIFNLVSRIYNPTGGEIVFDGRPITRVPPQAIARMGIARTFQNIELFDHASVIDNLLVGCHIRSRTNLLADMLFLPVVQRQEETFRRKVEEIIEFLELEHHREATIGSLAYGIRKVVEIGRALALEPKLLLLDEPSSGLNPEETDDMVHWIRDIRDDLGVTIIMVEHDMSLVRRVSDRVLAMESGRIIALGAPDAVVSDPQVVRAYLGD